MKNKFFRLSILFIFLVFLSACANKHMPEIKTIDSGVDISKTIESENKQGLKRKVAIARFSNETKYGQSFFIDKNSDRIGKQALDILSSKLIETEKFILLERADLDKIKKELTMDNYEPLKNMADYLIIGSITEFGRKTQGDVGIFHRTKRQTAVAKVHIRLVDVRSGQILYSEEGAGEAFSETGTHFGGGSQAGYDSSINDKALDAAITNLASNIIENLLDRPWRSYILGFDNGQIIMAGGKLQNIKVGDVFKVMKEGRQVKNPQTNMKITLPSSQVGKIKAVISVGDTAESEVTLCEIIDGDFKRYIDSNNFDKLFLQEE